MQLTEVTFVAALAVLAYTFVGYPLVIWALASCFPRAVRCGEYQPRVAVVIIVYNEAGRIGRKLETCLALDYPKDKLRVLVASDGSVDGTNERVAAYEGRGVVLLAFPGRRGKAACLNDAMASCHEEVIVLTDARQRLDAHAVRCLVENLADAGVGAASGELVFESDGVTGFGEGIDAYWRYEKFIRQQESRFHSVVGVTGALYALRRKCFREIPADTILDDVVIPMNVVMLGGRVVFENRAKAFELPSRDHRQEKLRKVRTIAGNYQLMAAHPAFFVPLRNPIFFQLLSHKVLRLVAPFCMALLLITNVVLAPRAFAYQCLLAAQLFAYALPAIGVLGPFARGWKVVKLATAFLLLNWFAVLGLVEFLRNRNVHLWRTRQPTPSGKS
jgi:cellulose synthase/poly-beta-1,6-N-acetylglucosamine synthase-like glycosyltransferase